MRECMCLSCVCVHIDRMSEVKEEGVIACGDDVAVCRGKWCDMSCMHEKRVCVVKIWQRSVYVFYGWFWERRKDVVSYF